MLWHPGSVVRWPLTSDGFVIFSSSARVRASGPESPRPFCFCSRHVTSQPPASPSFKLAGRAARSTTQSINFKVPIRPGGGDPLHRVRGWGWLPVPPGCGRRLPLPSGGPDSGAEPVDAACPRRWHRPQWQVPGQPRAQGGARGVHVTARRCHLCTRKRACVSHRV